MEDFDALVADLIKGEAPKDETPKDDGFKLHLGGRDYKFNTQEEAERAVETHMARLEEQARNSNAAAAAANQPPPPPAPTPKDGEVSEWTKNFVTALEKGDAKSVARLILKDGVFDGKIDDPSSVLTDSLLRTAQLDRQTSVNQFLSYHPELATDNAAASAVEQARQILGLPATPQGFEAAHAYAERIGQIRPGVREQSQSYNGPSQRSAPPSLPSSRSSNTGSGQPQTDAEWESFYNSRSDEDLNKLMNAAYAQR